MRFLKCNRVFGVVFVCCASLCPGLGAQGAASYEDCLGMALLKGPDFVNLAAQWSVNRETYAQALAKAGLVVSANLTWSLAGGYDFAHVDGAADPVLGAAGAGNMSGVSSSIVLPQSVSGGITMTSGNTKMGLTLAQALPVQLKATGSNTEGIHPGALVLSGTLSHVLWDGYAGGLPQAALQKARINVDAQEAAFQSGLVSLAGKYQTTFYALVQARESVEVATRIRDQKALANSLVQTRLGLNQASSIDAASAELALRGAEQELKGALQARIAASRRLCIATGLEPVDDFGVASPPDPKLPDFGEDEAVALGLEHRSDLRLLAWNLASLRIDQALYKAQLDPVLTLSGSPSAALKWDDGGLAFALGINLKLGLPLSDAGLAEHQQKGAAGSLEALGAQEDQLRKTIVTDIRDAWNQLHIKYDKWQLAAESAALAQRQYDLVNQAVELGSGRPKDLFDSGLALANALNSLVGAKGAVFAARAQLATAMAWDPAQEPPRPAPETTLSKPKE